MVSLKEIASLAGVSLGTVSFVLNGKGEQMRISKQTQRRVHEAAKQLGYRPNISAKRLRSQMEPALPVIAVLWTLDTRAALISRFFRGIHQLLTESSDLFELIVQPYEASRLKEVQSLFTGTKYNGAIIANATEEDISLLEKEPWTVPVVLFQRSSKHFHGVNVDNEQAGRRVAQIFAERAHRCSAIIIPAVSSEAIQLRKHGFLDESENLKLQITPAQIITEEFSEKGGYSAVKQMLSQDQLPSSAFFLSDQMAIGGLLALHEAGIRVPEDIEIIGYDNIEAAAFSIPPLSTVHLPIEEMAAASANMLLDIIAHRSTEPITAWFDTQYIARGTCGEAGRQQ